MFARASAIHGSGFAGLQSAVAMLDDGVYGLSFSNGNEACCEEPFRSEGLAVLRDGVLLGSDRNGIVFRGRCTYNAARDEAHVTLKLAIPPNGVLLTGLEAGPEGALLEIAGRFDPPRPLSSTLIEIGGERLAVELRFVGPLKQS